ncbi:FecCD family ABC transporter permease [Agromyces sp. SYSU T00194]|uniref:FecCD family ABC transporter permease n=1 Tax=Agromyces chitinivorans TaxID=3158560 RepID=UPI003399B995
MASARPLPPPVTGTAAAVVAVRARRVRRRGLVIAGAVGVIVVAALVALLLGAADLDPLRVLRALVGVGEPADEFVVHRLRLPRILAALIAGSAFALAGAIFQSVLRNPLASPDILGIASGASLGAVWAILGLGITGAAVAPFAFGGALAVAVAIWLLAWRQGLHGIRFVLVGVGMAYLCGSALAWLLARADVRDAQSALVWTVGSLADVRGDALTTLAIGVGLLALLAVLPGRSVEVLALGDDHARALGVASDRARVLLLLVAVGLVAVATSVAGPIAFVALVAPAIARSLLRDGSAALVVAALCGAALTLAADVIGQYALPGGSAPVGIVTGIVGAPYLLWLLATGRRTRA